MKHFLLVLFTGVLFISCQKESSNSFFEYPNAKQDTTWHNALPANALVRSFPVVFGKSAVADTFNNTTSVSLNFNDSVFVNVPANSFVTNIGAVVTDNIVMQVINLARKGDMIKNSKPTQSYQYPLITGGSINIKATALNGQQLKLAPGKRLRVNIVNKFVNTQLTNQMRLFYGFENAFSNDVLQPFTWVPTNDTISLVPGQQANVLTYSFLTDSLNWINCDYFSDTTLPRTKLAITTPLTFTNANTTVYIVFKDINSVVQANSDAVNRYFYSPNIPVGRNVTIVSISKIDNDFYLGTSDMVTLNGVVGHVTPQLKTQQQVIDYFNSL